MIARHHRHERQHQREREPHGRFAEAVDADEEPVRSRGKRAATESEAERGGSPGRHPLPQPKKYSGPNDGERPKTKRREGHGQRGTEHQRRSVGQPRSRALTLTLG